MKSFAIFLIFAVVIASVYAGTFTDTAAIVTGTIGSLGVITYRALP
jgi:hypothetical protein